MHKVLVVMDVLEEHKALLDKIGTNLRIEYIPSAKVTPENLQDAEIIVGNIKPSLLVHCKKLRLLQLNSAGTNGYTDDGILPENGESKALLANATGAYGLAISEHMIAGLLCLMKKLDLYRLNQEKSEWHDEGPVTSIFGSKTLIVGFGDIGSEFGKRMNALGSTVYAIRKNIKSKPDYIESLHTMDNFYDRLKDADIVATCLPDTPETRGIFDKKAFDAMKNSAYFINVGRGNSVKTDDLYDSLKNNKLSGAILDVTDPEPLPKEHPLWNLKNVLITPHVSGGFHLKETHNRIIKIAEKNIMHLLNDEPFENLVDMKTGYRKS